MIPNNNAVDEYYLKTTNCDLTATTCNKYVGLNGEYAILIDTPIYSLKRHAVPNTTNEYYFENRFGCNRGDNRCGMWLSFRGSKLRLYAGEYDKITWKFIEP